MEDFDSGWDEPPSSLDSENMNYDIGEAMNGYEPSELRQQVLEMRDDPAMPFTAPNGNSSTPENKDTSSVDCSSLSSEIFLATRLLHDETLDSTTLTTLGEPESSPYNDTPDFNNYLGSPLESDTQQDTIDSIGLPQREALDSEFLYSSFEQLRSERQDLDYDEECSNKSWADSLPPSEIMPAPLRAISRKNTSERSKAKGERKKRIIKIIKKKSFTVNNNVSGINKIETAIATDTKIPEEKMDSKGEDHLNSTNLVVNLPHLQKPTVNIGIGEEFLIPSTSASGANMIQKKDGRKVPSYLKMYRLRDEKYPDIFACKNCYGIFTTLDSAMFHPCLKKRRGRRPKILEDCVVPL